MSRLCKNILIVILGLVVLDQTAGVVLDYLRKNAPDGRYYKARYSLEQSTEPVVIIGSSRGESNFAPFVFADSLGMPVWNASRGGQGLPYFQAMQQGLLARYVPHMVILNIEADMLEQAPFYQPVGFLRPFYRSHPEIRGVIDNISSSEPILLYSRLLAYNSSFYYLLRPYLVKGLDGLNEDQGWKPRSGQIPPAWQRELEVFRLTDSLHPEAVAAFEQICRAFLDVDVKLYLVVSPNYAEVTASSATLDYLRAFAQKENVTLLEYVNDTSLSSKPTYFVDYQHLNREGSIAFSQMVAGDILSHSNR